MHTSPLEDIDSKRGFKACTKYGAASDNEVFDFLMYGVYPVHIQGVGLGKKRKEYKKNATRRYRMRRGSGQESKVALEELWRNGEGSAVKGGGKNSFVLLRAGTDNWGKFNPLEGGAHGG